MEDEFYKDEFEQFLQQQANNHRMYPSDGVWHGIYKKLHGDKKWPALTITAFAILFATIATSIYFSPKPNIFNLENLSATITPANNTTVSGKGNSNLINTLSNSVKKTTVSSKNLVAQQIALTPVKASAGLNSNFSIISLPNQNLASDQSNQAIASSSKSGNNKDIDQTIKTKKYTIAPHKTLSSREPLLTDYNKEVVESGFVDLKVENSQRKDLELPKKGYGKPSLKEKNDKNIGDNFLKEHGEDLSLFTATRTINQKRKFSYTIYITPSVSYRKLKEDQNLNTRNGSLNGPVAVNYLTDVNKLVRHKPGNGIEAGIGFTYHLTNTFGIKTGLQFNMRQYTIEAYRASTELATIALLSNRGIDSIRSYAIYRTNSSGNGNLSTDLINRYYQVSVPIGIEWEVFGNRNMKFNVAASLQPTYTINKNAYLLSTNLKNYTANSTLVRNWNLNSSMEAYLSLKVGEYNWQIGPQLRYQTLPTFVSEYPIREHLVDYGFKIGVSKLIK